MPLIIAAATITKNVAIGPNPNIVASR